MAALPVLVVSADDAGRRLQHLVAGLDRAAVHLVGALRDDQVDGLVADLPVAALDEALLELTEPDGPRRRRDRRARRVRLAHDVAADRQQARRVDEARDVDRAEQLRRVLVARRAARDAALLV